MKRSSSDGSYDTGDKFLQGGSFLLTLVQDAAQYAPVPYLQDAAGSVLYIFNAIAAAKNNREDFHRLADNAVSLIAAIWQSYKMSKDQSMWPSRSLRDIILDLVLTLDSIVQFVKTRVSKPWVVRIIYHVIDSSKLAEYRERLTSAVQTFQVSSDLNVNEMLLEVLKKQDSLSKQIEKNAVSSGRGGPYVHRQLEDAPKSINADYGRGRDQTSYVPKEQRQMDQLISEAALEDSRNRYLTRPRPVPVPMATFSNIQNTGISMGGGSVHVVNG